MTKTQFGVADHPNKDLMQNLWEDGLRAQAIVQELQDRGLPPVKKTTLARYGQRYWNKSKVTVEIPEAELSGLGETIEAASKYGEVSKVNISTKNTLGWEKQDDGTNLQVEKELTTHTVEVEPNTGRAANPIKVEVGPFKISRGKRGSAKPRGWNLAISYPDKQTGYFRFGDKFLPIHDEAALDVAYQIQLDLEREEGVDLVVNQGDDLDFAEFSSHRSTPGYKNLLNKNLNRHASDLAIQRDISPEARIVQLFGNHEARLEKFLADKAPELLGVTRVGDEQPVISIPYLCKYEEMGITWSENYPQGEYWANEYLKFVHGTVASGVPGAAAGKTLGKSSGASVVYGHDHYQAIARDAVPTKDGMREVFAASGGCLCRKDGLVPSTVGTISSSGKMVSKERWQQGILVIYYEPEGLQRSVVEPVHINSGSAIFRGKIYQSTVDVNGEIL